MIMVWAVMMDWSRRWVPHIASEMLRMRVVMQDVQAMRGKSRPDQDVFVQSIRRYRSPYSASSGWIVIFGV
jgi:hypothetical protein